MFICGGKTRKGQLTAEEAVAMQQEAATAAHRHHQSDHNHRRHHRRHVDVLWRGRPETGQKMKKEKDVDVAVRK